LREVQESHNKSKKKNPPASVGVRGGRAWSGCSKRATWKKKKAVSKESEGGDSLLERTENGRKVG